jgi:hypothetical protein
MILFTLLGRGFDGRGKGSRGRERALLGAGPRNIDDFMFRREEVLMTPGR